MQKDEEVGKVAQVAPVLICNNVFLGPNCITHISKLAKALELFMQNLIDETCVITKDCNAKKMSTAHL
jgi:hypothetical protein